MNIPIATTEGHGGFSPELSLSYDSGLGNGIFGLGWHLSIPTIFRKIDKGLSHYFDGEESDTFILSGSEDLVPVDNPEYDVTGTDYTVKQYHPCIEGLFARIEKWTKGDDVYWRAITKENITSIYGKGSNSRIANPENSSQIFSWLLCESYDDKGNAIIYEYHEDDAQSIELSALYEKNKNIVNRYIKSIKYGNQTSRLLQSNLSKMKWHFEVEFEYTESIREDPFSSYCSGLRCELIIFVIM